MPTKEPGTFTRCKARTQKGEPCKRPPIAGAAVCRVHGGAAPQVKRKAAMRLLELVDPAIATLAKEMVKAEKSGDRLRAANSILDRAGYGRVTKVEGQDAKEILVERLLQMQASNAPQGTPDKQDAAGELTGTSTAELIAQATETQGEDERP